MSILLFNGFLLLGFVVATERLVLGSPGAMQAVEAPVKKCRYSRIRSMLQADCDSLELHDIPRHLQADIEVRIPRAGERADYLRLSLLMSCRMRLRTPRLASLLLRERRYSIFRGKSPNFRCPLMISPSTDGTVADKEFATSHEN
jgi:hypothetical protein